MPLLSLLAAPAAAAAIAVTADHADPPACRPVDAGIQVAGAGRDAVEAQRPAVVRLPRPEPPAGAPQPSSIAPPPAPQQSAQQSAQEIAHEGPRVLIWAIGHESSGVPEEWAAGEGQPGVHYCSCSTEDVERLAALVAAEKREGQVRMGVWMWVWVCKCGMRRMPPFQCAGGGGGVCAHGAGRRLCDMPCHAQRALIIAGAWRLVCAWPDFVAAKLAQLATLCCAAPWQQAGHSNLPQDIPRLRPPGCLTARMLYLLVLEHSCFVCSPLALPLAIWGHLSA